MHASHELCRFIGEPGRSMSHVIKKSQGLSVSRLAALGTALVMGVVAALVVPSGIARADDESLHVDAYLVSSATYDSVNADISVRDFADIEKKDIHGARVTVHRIVGGDIVKVSKDEGIVGTTLSKGGVVTVPFVIREGTYDEADSSSWVKPDAVWTPETVPTSLTVEILGANGEVLLSRTVGVPETTGSVTLRGILPAAPAFTNPAAAFHNAADYKGITVAIRTKNFADAEQVTVEVARANGAPVSKVSKPAAMVHINKNAGNLTAPIVIQPGTYDEPGSSSWIMPSALWTSANTPTEVTITITRTYGPAVTTTIPITGSIDGIMPAADVPPTVTLPSEGPFELEIPEDVTEVELDLGTVDDDQVTVNVPVVVRAANGAELSIPEGTTITAPEGSDWDGTITLPQVREDVVVPDTEDGRTATVSLAIEVGVDGVPLMFDKPVRLVLPGQAGQSAGFVQLGEFQPIEAACESDEPSLSPGAACWLNDGDDLVIWTTHFTTFVAYSMPPATGNNSTPALKSGDRLAATGSGDSALIAAVGGALVLLGGVVILARRRERNAA